MTKENCSSKEIWSLVLEAKEIAQFMNSNVILGDALSDNLKAEVAEILLNRLTLIESKIA